MATTDPSSIAQNESEAQQLVADSWLHTRQLPNPQLATEAISTGATPDISNAFGDPELASYMTATPSGTGQPVPPDNGQNQPGQDVNTFDPQKYQQYNQGLAHASDDVKRQTNWNNDLNQAPILNTGYMNSVLTSSDPNTVKTWQSFLHNRGFYGQSTGYNSGNNKWGTDDQAALQSYFVYLAAPEALWAKDPQRQNQAKLFLQNIGVDPNALATQVSQDPEAQAKYATGWLYTQGTADQEMDNLHNFADRFGPNNLPKPWQTLADPGFLANIAGTIGAVNPFKVIGGLASNIPVVGGVIQGATNVASAPINVPLNILMGHGLNVTDPTAVETQNITKALSPQDQELLAPALNKAAQSTGFLPIQQYEEGLTKSALAIGFLFDGARQGIHFNPLDTFDPSTPLGRYTEAHKDDLMAGMLGDKWAQDNPTWDKFGNITLGIIDDPLNAVGFGKSLAGMRLIGRAMHGTQGLRRIDGMAAAAQLVSEDTRATALRNLNPRAKLQVEVSRMLTQVRDNPAADHMIRLVTGLTSSDAMDLGASEFNSDVDKFVDFVKDKSNSAEDIRQNLADNFGHVFHASDSIVQYKDRMKMLGRLNKASADDVVKLRTVGAIGDVGKELNLNDTFGTAQTLHESLAIGGVAEDKINEFLGDLYKAANTDKPGRSVEYQKAVSQWKQDVVQAREQGKPLPAPPNKSDFAGQMEDLINTKFRDLLEGEGSHLAKVGKTLDDVRALHMKLARGKSFKLRKTIADRVGPNQRLSQVTYSPVERGGQVVEYGRAPRQFAPATTTKLQDLDHQMQVVQDTYKDSLQLVVDNLMKTDPKMREVDALDQAEKSDSMSYVKADRDQKIATLKQEADRITPLGRDRPVPMASGQGLKTAYLPVTPFELATYLNPVLRNSERLQSLVMADAFMTLWKPLVLLRPATMLKVLMGDDTTRTSVHVALKGHPIQAIRGFLGATAKGTLAGYHVPKARKWLDEADQNLGSNAAARMQASFYSSQIDESVFAHYHPGDAGYEQAFQRWYKSFLNSPEVKMWAKGTRKNGDAGGVAALKQYANQGNLKDIELIAQNNMSVDQWAQFTHEFYSDKFSLGKHTQALKWIEDGAISRTQFAKLYKDPDIRNRLFPIVTAPRLTLFSHNTILNAIQSGPTRLMHHMLEPMIQAARGSMFRTIKADWEREIKGIYGDKWTNEKIGTYATVEAKKWMAKNLYQGQRTVMGRSLRNAFPFWGATANMDRFWLKQARMHPWIADPGMRYLNWQEETANQPQKAGGMFPNVLSALGFAGGDAINFDPAHMFFVTNDGLGAFVPGVGPLFSPLMNAVSKDQGLMDVLGAVPGLKESIGYQSGPYAGSPLHISWLEKILSGVGLASPLHHPFDLSLIGGSSDQYQANLNKKLQQLMADYYQGGSVGRVPTPDDAATQLGKELLTEGAANFIAPVNAAIGDPRSAAKSQAMTAFRSATTQTEKDAVKAQYPEIQPLLDYLDPNTPMEKKNQIGVETPWVVPYATSYYEAGGTEQMYQEGKTRTLTPDYYLPQIQKEFQLSQGWYQMNGLTAAENNYLVAHPDQTRASKEYKAWVAQNVSPYIADIMNNNSAFADAFMTEKRRDLPGLDANTRPIRTFLATEALPQMNGFETPTTVTWRKAMVYLQNTQDQIYQLVADGGSSSDKQAALDSFQQELDALKSEDPQFAAEMTPFRYRQLEDVINLRAMEEKAQANA